MRRLTGMMESFSPLDLSKKNVGFQMDNEQDLFLICNEGETSIFEMNMARPIHLVIKRSTRGSRTPT